MINQLPSPPSGSRWIAAGASLAAVTVLLGAFGAHALPQFIQGSVEDPQKSLQNWETASRYQMYHSIGIAIVGFCFAVYGKRFEFQFAGICFLVGITVFSGMLYTLAVTDIKILGAMVPLGGVAMILGWVALAVGAWRTSNQNVTNPENS